MNKPVADDHNFKQQLFDYVVKLNRFLELETDPKRKALAKRLRKNLQEQRRSLVTGSSCFFPNISVMQAASLVSET